jgi:hypothetical protein
MVNGRGDTDVEVPEGRAEGATERWTRGVRQGLGDASEQHGTVGG